MPTLTTFIQQCSGSLSHSNHTRWGNKNFQIGKEAVKLSLFTNDMIFYIQNSKVSTPKLLEPVNEFNRVAGYTVNIQKPVAFSCTRNGIPERESRKQSHFKSHQKE